VEPLEWFLRKIGNFSDPKNKKPALELQLANLGTPTVVITKHFLGTRVVYCPLTQQKLGQLGYPWWWFHKLSCMCVHVMELNMSPWCHQTRTFWLNHSETFLHAYMNLQNCSNIFFGGARGWGRVGYLDYLTLGSVLSLNNP
jgi:hypothetical protein